MKTPSQPVRTLHGKSAFTLIELLAVIAIIAVLAALLMPMLNRMRWASANTKCLNNLRNLQIANQLYAGDHNGKYVSTTSWDGDAKIETSWMNNTDFLTYLSRLEEISNPEFYAGDFPPGHLCPAVKMLGSSTPNVIGANYGMNMAYNDALGFPAWGTKGGVWQVSIANLANPGQTVAFADCQNWLLKKSGLLSYNVANEGPSDSGALAYRHKGRANVVRYDGSVASFTKADLADPKIMSQFTLE